MFREAFNDKKIMVIDDIEPFSEHTYKKELNEWKSVKLSKEELKKSELKKIKMCMT